MLRPYQQESVSEASHALFKENHRAIIIQGATGSGKTPITSSICHQALKNNFTAWFIVPRKELLKQASQHFKKWKIPHGIIAPGYKEMSVYKIHIVSSDTLIRRYGQIKNHPDLILIDECHIAIDRQMEIAKRFPKSKIIGLTATPEKSTGQGLSKKSGALYDKLINGKSIKWLIEHEFLSPLRYFSPPIQGLDKLHRKGTDYDDKELDSFLKKNKIYGEAIEHYRKYAHNKPALVFCRNVAAAYDTAEQFRMAGYEFYCIEGKMKDKERAELIEALRTGKIHGLTNCEIATYGLDIPRVEVGICLRPTMSRALYFQMVGRVLRPFEGKTEAIFFDHVNNLYEHLEPEYPDVPPFYAPEVKWNFHGVKKRKKQDMDEAIRIMSLRVCPKCFMHSTTPGKCSRCGEEFEGKKQKKIEVIDGVLVEAKPAKFNELPEEEKREHIDAVNNCVREYRDALEAGDMLAPGPIGKLLDIAKERGYQPLWVYRRLVSDDQKTVNVTLLHEICRQKGYSPKAVHFMKKTLEKSE